jgi:DNA (cytosine-5)-methyltransferase 1
LLRPSFKPYFDYILRELEFPFAERDEDTPWFEHDAILKRRQKAKNKDSDEHYRVHKFEVNAADYGVPQIRNRVIIVAFRGDQDLDESLLRKAVERTHSEGALLQSMASGEYWDRHPTKAPKHVRDRVMAGLQGTLSFDEDELGLEPWRTLRDAQAGIDDDAKERPEVPWDRLDRVQYKDMPVDHIGWPDARIYPGHTPNTLDRPAKTVKAGVHGVPGGESVVLTDTRIPRAKAGEQRYRHRYMTVRETARVMTFPDDWKLRGPRGEKMRQLGNAVPVRLGEVFAEAVATVLDDVERRS